tara:strand:- start:47 stop:742 length:696 start_codon:yes stop_codon:yes gene_type:complete
MASYQETMKNMRENAQDVSLGDGLSVRQYNSSMSNIWLLSFTDIIALMLVFFVMLFAMSQPDEDVWVTMVQGMSQGQKENSASQGEESTGLYGTVDMDRIRRQPALSTNYLFAVLKRLQENNALLSTAHFESFERETHLTLPYDSLFDADDPRELSVTGRETMALLTGTLGHLQNRMDIVLFGAPDRLETKILQSGVLAGLFTAKGYKGQIRIISHAAPVPRLRLVIYSGR